MPLDNELIVSDNQDNIRAVGNIVSTNVIDLIDMRAKFAGTPIAFFVKVVSAFASSGNATLAGQIQHSDNEDFSAGSATTIELFGATAISELSAGSRLANFEYVPANISSRYIRFRYTVAVAAMTAGSIIAGLEPKRADGRDGRVPKTYPSNFTGS